jgi:hypothetical protein
LSSSRSRSRPCTSTRPQSAAMRVVAQPFKGA